MPFFPLRTEQVPGQESKEAAETGAGWMGLGDLDGSHEQCPCSLPAPHARGWMFDAGVVMPELSLLILPRDGVCKHDFMGAELGSESARLGILVWRPGAWSNLGPRWGALCLFGVTLGSCFPEC